MGDSWVVSECILLGRGFDSVPKFGPVVVMVSVTAVALAPAEMDAGLKAQLVSTGNPEQANVTFELNALLPTGAAKKE